MSNKNQANLLKFLECNLPVLPLNRNKEPIIYEHKFFTITYQQLRITKTYLPLAICSGLNAETHKQK
jgi:hypothetical protein